MSRYFLFVFINGVVSSIKISNLLLLVYDIIIDLYRPILYPAILLNLTLLFKVVYFNDPTVLQIIFIIVT